MVPVHLEDNEYIDGVEDQEGHAHKHVDAAPDHDGIEKQEQAHQQENGVTKEELLVELYRRR